MRYRLSTLVLDGRHRAGRRRGRLCPAGAGRRTWSAADCQTCHETTVGSTFERTKHAGLKDSCASCHLNVAEHVQGPAGRRGQWSRAVDQEAHGERGQRHLPDLPREGPAGQLGRAALHDRRNVACTSCHSVHAQVGEGAAARPGPTPKPATRATSRSGPRRCARRTTRCAKARWAARAATTRTTAPAPSCCRPTRPTSSATRATPRSAARSSSSTRRCARSARRATTRTARTTSGCSSPSSPTSASAATSRATGSPPTTSARWRGCRSRRPGPPATRSSRNTERGCKQCHLNIHGSNSPSGAFFVR